ncbi:winged helix-turn-helix transcriptional regulator [Candidatus Nomurabacteria bacterium]|nr:winged helix-turn-helix transcriptional regulator [Candidatus Kaiserbacteria bacterium]MCB9814137.1 winged helix-turn-helix transcriptional regulator [Candidatus Nomurabacteria bacterium]
MSDKSIESITYPRPKWVKASVTSEEELCPDCFKVVGVKSRYTIVCALGKSVDGLTVTELTEKVGLRQPTITHHLNILRGVDAVSTVRQGREKLYSLNRNAHCFEECQIPY